MFTITGSSNIHFLKFWHFNFSNFQTTFVKFFTKKPPSFKIDFESTVKVLPLHQYLWSEISRQWNNGSLIFFWNLHGRAFCYLILLLILSKERNIKDSILQILLKWMVVGYSNGNKSFTGRMFSNYGLLTMLFHFFFDISFIVFFTRLLSKSLRRNYTSSVQISKINFKM